MDRKDVEKIFRKVDAINSVLALDVQIVKGFRDGRGYFIELPDCIYTSIMNKKKYYITIKTYSHVNFILKNFDRLMEFESDMATILLDALED